MSNLRERYEAKLRVYERTHAVWMNTNMFNEEAKTRAEADLATARTECEEARQAFYNVVLPIISRVPGGIR